MIQLIYTSAAREPFSTDALRQLLVATRGRNAKSGITGLLLYDRGSFIQALEGEASKVDETFERIKRDPRHHRITVLGRRPLDAREFSEWSMGFVDLEGPRAQRLSGFADVFGAGATVGASLGSAHTLLEAFRIGRLRSFVSAQ
jgi:hypothetical protein